MGLALSEKETCGCQEPAEAVPSPTTSDEWTKVPPGILADMPHQNIPGHMQPGLWGPSERLARGCEVNEKEKGNVMSREVQSDAKGWHHDRMAFDLLRYTDPWNKTADGKGIKTCTVDVGQGSIFEQGEGHRWFNNPIGYYGQPAQSPTGYEKGKG